MRPEGWGGGDIKSSESINIVTPAPPTATIYPVPALASMPAPQSQSPPAPEKSHAQLRRLLTNPNVPRDIEWHVLIPWSPGCRMPF